MSETNDVGPEALDEFRLVVAAYRALHRSGTPVRYWEVFCLLRVDAALLRHEVRYLSKMARHSRPAAATQLLLERLAAVRRRYGPLAAAFTRLAARLPDPPRGGELWDMTVGAWLLSDHPEEMLSRWAADPAARGRDARETIARLEALVRRYRRTYRRAADARRQRLIAPRTTVESDGRARPRSDRSPRRPSNLLPLPEGIDPDLLGDLRRVETFHALMKEAFYPSERWEVLSVVTEEPARTRPLLDTIKDNALLEVIPSELIRELFRNLGRWHAERGALARAVRAYIALLPLGTFGKGTLDLALALLVASPRGRAAAAAWIQDPRRHAAEASQKVEVLVRIAPRYESVLRDSASGVNAPRSS